LPSRDSVIIVSTALRVRSGRRQRFQRGERRGRFKDNAGKWHTVEAGNGHRADLDSV
jgi:hypothetical protein